MALQEASVTGARVTQEQLGDLKLYRVPQRTTVASRQAKQVRLLDRASIPVHRVYAVQLQFAAGAADSTWVPASMLLRTRNDDANHLGLPLPSGRVSVFQVRASEPLLLSEANLRDLAVNEEVEIPLGRSSDVQVKSIAERMSMDAAHARTIPLVPGIVGVRSTAVDVAQRVEVSNARSNSVDVELLLNLDPSVKVVRADHPVGSKNGQPIFRLSVPANGTGSVRYQTATIAAHLVPAPR
jgi:hypothetical protein